MSAGRSYFFYAFRGSTSSISQVIAQNAQANMKLMLERGKLLSKFAAGTKRARVLH